MIVLPAMIMEVCGPMPMFHRRWKKIVLDWRLVFHMAIAGFLNLLAFMFIPPSSALLPDASWIGESISGSTNDSWAAKEAQAPAFEAGEDGRRAMVASREYLERETGIGMHAKPLDCLA